jgi:hypothetical protein
VLVGIFAGVELIPVLFRGRFEFGHRHLAASWYLLGDASPRWQSKPQRPG